MRNRYLNEYIDRAFPILELQYAQRNGDERNMEREQPTIWVIAGGPTLAGDSNRV